MNINTEVYLSSYFSYLFSFGGCRAKSKILYIRIEESKMLHSILENCVTWVDKFIFQFLNKFEDLRRLSWMTSSNPLSENYVFKFLRLLSILIYLSFVVY